MSDFFNVVSKDVAANPVARAIAKRRIQSAIRDFLLECYFVQEGTEQRSNYLAAARVLAVATRLSEMARDHGTEDMSRAMRCCQAANERGFTWTRDDALFIDYGLSDALERINASSARELQRAWVFVMELERAAEAA